MLASAAAEVEELLDSRSSRGTEAIPQGRLLHKALDRSGEARRVARRDKQSGLAVDDQLGDAPDARCDDGKSGGHRLEDRERKPFRPGR
jgi:hypothetical protein